MHYLSVDFVTQPLHVSGIFVAHHQEVYCICMYVYVCVCVCVCVYIYIYIQGVPGGMDKTSGECSLCCTIPI